CYESSCSSPGVVCTQCSCLRVTESKLRGRVGLQSGAKRALEGAEPGLVVAPMLHGVAKDGLSHLFGACRAHCACILVEPQAALLERQAAVVEQTSHFGFRVLDQGLVNDAVDPAR